MLTKTVTIQNEVGLHTRPATFFVQKASNYNSSVWIENCDRRANAKSLLGVLSLGISKGDNVSIIANGPDEAEAVDGLIELLMTLE